MNRIQIPVRLNDRLGNSALAHAIRLYIEQIEKWVGDDTKGLFFFPEYTDHGPSHITSVLAGAEALIREEAWEVLTPEDTAILVLATLLHDSAMHLTADGLMGLLDPARTYLRPLHALDEATWPQLFDDFFAEARRWDQRKLRKILGDERVPEEEEEDLIDYIRRPAPAGEPWPEPYRKFMGEFLRRHHARLAHEIALYGVPGYNPGTLKPERELDGIADLAGLVARSHNMHLRETFNYLQQRYWGRVTCQGAHPVFLMVLLRIADYLEIRSDRTNPTLQNLQRLRSPISREEHDAHKAVHEIRPDEHDEEAIFVIAKPASGRLFLKLKGLLAGLQEEIDTSWAVLGEVFSRQRDLSRLGITLRRVRSNIDDPKKFTERENPSYFPIRAGFDTAGADLLKLLIKPLYGDRPDIGIRELLQNSLDAVRELRRWTEVHGHSRVASVEQEGDVEISITRDKHGYAWFTIADKGIGMTPEVVRDYFLKAGASYRQSDAWRQEFEVEGKSQVLRSGRFGIGALAAFLLGPKVEVFTRHVTAGPDDGVYMRASVSDDSIELSRIKQDQPGTLIRIPLSQLEAQRLMSVHLWDWYALDDPRIVRSSGGSVHQPQHQLKIDPAEVPPNDWREISQASYQKFLWSYSKAPALTCNGIVIQQKSQKSILSPWRRLSGGFLELPNICIFDPDGKLPLRLTRDRLEEKLPYISELVESVAKDLLAWLLTRPSCEFLSPNFFLRESWLGNMDKVAGTDCLLLSNEGFSLFHPWFVRKANLLEILLIFCSRSAGRIIKTDMPALRLITKHEVSYYERQPFELGGMRREGIEDWGFRKADLHETKDPELTKNVQIVNWAIDQSTFPFVDTLFSSLLEKYMHHPVIPFDPAERRAKFPKAFDELSEYIETWERPDLVGWRKEMTEG